MSFAVLMRRIPSQFRKLYLFKPPFLISALGEYTYESNTVKTDRNPLNQKMI